MYQGKIAIRYARSLFMVAKERNILDKVYQDMKELLKLENTDKDFRNFLISPIFKESEKIKFFKQLFSGKINDLTLDFCLFIIRKRRESFLAAMSRSFIDQYRQEKGIKPVSITTATKIEKALAEKISKLISKDLDIKVELEQKTDESIIGGYILRIEDRQFDDSVATKLQKFKQLLQQRVNNN